LPFTDRPGGIVPVFPQKYGDKPPLAVNWNPLPPAPYCVPTTPFGGVPEKLIINFWAAAGIVIVQLRLAVCPAASLTVTVNGWLAPGCVACPVSTPVPATIMSIVGAPDSDHVKGPVPVAVNVTLTVSPNVVTAGN
jgi:hypothetical protein